MAYFYFTRHGQTIWNVENKICGATDIALTELGHTQAKELGERIKAEGIHIDKILYSPPDACGRYRKAYRGSDRRSGRGRTAIEGAEFWTV